MDLRFSGGQHQLLDWLKECTFPMESKFADVEFAERKYRSVVRRIIDNGVGLLFFSDAVETDRMTDNHMLLLWHHAS